jgi:hypothetical protein
MDAPSSAKTLGTIVALVALVAACSRPTSRRSVSDTTRLDRRTVGAEAIRVPDDVRVVCDSVAAMWRHVPEAKIVASDTVIVPPTDDPPSGDVPACQVVATVDSITDTSHVPETYWHMTHWPELIGWHADGPDGESGIYQRGFTRCDLARQWDGGDDEDTTAAVSSFQQETTLCWRHSRPLVATDTGFPVDSPTPAPIGGVTGTIIRRPVAKKPPA